MKIEQFNKQNLPSIRAEINEALSAISEKYGIKLNIGNINFTDNSFKSTLSCSIPGKTFDYSNSLPGLPSIGTKFQIGGKIYTVIEHHPERPKFDIVATDQTGKRVKVTSDGVKRSAIK